MKKNQIDGSAHSWKRLQNFLKTEAAAEIAAFHSFRTQETVRVMVMRHGMAHNNSYAGMGTIINEDAQLTRCGRAEALVVGDRLRADGVIDSLAFTVVSPFTRAMQTALHVLGPAVGAKLPEREVLAAKFGLDPSPPSVNNPQTGPMPLKLQPLAAEMSTKRSHVGRGNRGSTAEELARTYGDELNLVFDLDSLGEYCNERCVGTTPFRKGKWWHHGPHARETGDSFRRRCAKLRRWLGSLGQGCAGEFPKVLLISHGGVLENCFDSHPSPPNCSFRVYDIAEDGGAVHVATQEKVKCSNILLHKPYFEVHMVRCHIGHCEITLGVDGECFSQTLSASELRSDIYDVVRKKLPPKDCSRLHLAKKIPKKIPLSSGSLHIQDYLEQLAVAMVDPAFPHELLQYLDRCLLRGRSFG